MSRLSKQILLVAFLTVMHASLGFPMGKTKESGSGVPGFFRPTFVKAPNFETCTHRYNNLLLTVSNSGFFGAMMEGYLDCETGLGAPSCEFPAGTKLDYLYAAGLWVGAVVGADTLVSCGWDGWQWIYEMWPCAEPECGLHKRSTRSSEPFYSDSAKSDLEYIAEFTDTLAHPSWTQADWDGREHIPLNIKVLQTSYSWSVDYAQDFVLIDFQFINMGIEPHSNVYVGLLVDGDVSHISRQRGSWTDDICGFRETFPSKVGHGFMDTLNLAWIADNDGDPEEGAFDIWSVPALTGVKVMRTPVKNTKVSFNWWTANGSPSFDWGPMMEANRRNYGTGGLGTPEGDRSKYYMMSNGEQDYDQIFAAANFTDLGWLPPSSTVGEQVAQGGDTRYLISSGPFDIAAGDTLPLTIAYIGGEDFHRRPDDYKRLMVDKYDPAAYYATLDFTDIADNSVWASWIYDNPGFDTDGDGYAGPTWVIEDTLPDGRVVLDTVFYAGDGVPDFRASTAPPPPVLRTSTGIGRVTLRWNGLISENFIDPFTRLQDFEGYNVYYGRLKRADQFALIESRDYYDFKRYYWDLDEEDWMPADEIPVNLDSLRQLYGMDFDPADHECQPDGTGFPFGGTEYCFESIGWNQSLEGWADGAPTPISSGIRKRFAHQIASGEVTPELDSTITENWVEDIDPISGSSILYHKFYEYEFFFENLLSSIPWYFSVTAFDFGDFTNNFGILESSPMSNAVEVWAINDAAAVVENDLQVSVYPNPYFGNGSYVSSGYEDPDRTGFVDHERRIHFVNLPPKCTIKIFTVSGDMVRELHHPGNFSSTDSKLQWNMRSRNNEIVTSGIYIFSLESEWGNQIGKIVIIL